MDTGRCEACWDCMVVCPKQVLGKMDILWLRPAVIRNAEACSGCKKCVQACESGVIEYIHVPKSRAARSEDERPAFRAGTDSV
jgi:Fe-S-cluster-containing hydrogenase component 2